MYVPIKKWDKRKTKRNSEGYILVNVPHHPKSFNGWYYEHRLVMERKYDRILEDWETIHHINQNKSDNRERNLFICTVEQHSKAHKN